MYGVVICLYICQFVTRYGHMSNPFFMVCLHVRLSSARIGISFELDVGFKLGQTGKI